MSLTPVDSDQVCNPKCAYDRLVPLSELLPHPKNNNKHPEEQIERLSKIIEYQGMRSPIVVSKLSGFITKGHGRLMAMRSLGWTHSPVNYQDYKDEDQEYADITADNAIASWAELDLSMVNAELENLGPFDIDLLGIKDFVVEPIEKYDEQTQDDVPEVTHDPITKRGDVWLLGEHRVMCGDSTMIDEVDKLMKGDKADMVFTDPPYGIAYSSSKFDGNTGGLTNKRNKADMIIGDGEKFDPSFLLDFFPHIKEMFIWGFQYYPKSLGRGGVIVWNKKNENEQDNPHGDFELCWSKVERNKMFWKRWGGFNNKEKGETRLHTTQKPTDLALWFLEKWGKDYNIIDLFLGSGSTLIACEKTNRKCYGMELDEHYCDVIVERWQKYTGKKAKLESSGESYNDLRSSYANAKDRS